jgi:ADP-ribosylglycohydrolase
MVSDDTDHARMTAQALIEAGDDPSHFARRLAQYIRGWLLGFPAGVGLATLRAGIKLLMGRDPWHSGVFSAGNGPAMRAPVIGVAFCDDQATMCRMVRASTRLTHTDPKAEWGALAAAMAASMSSVAGETIPPGAYTATLSSILPPEADELLRLVHAAAASAESGDSTMRFADELGLSAGVGGYIYHTIPIVIQTWLRHQTDCRAGILEVVRCGGDTDTTAAILGGIIGARVGRAGVPADWIARIYDPAYPPEGLNSIAEQLAEVRRTGLAGRAPSVPAVRRTARNIVFTTAVMAHGLRRLIPPY